MDLGDKNNYRGKLTLWIWLGLEDSYLNGKIQVVEVFLCWLMVRISIQFNGFWRRFSKNEGWRYFCHVPNSSWFDACGLWEYFFLQIINDYVFVQNNIGSQVEDLSENLSTNKTSLLVHLKFCCPWNDCQHPENPNWTYI